LRVTLLFKFVNRFLPLIFFSFYDKRELLAQIRRGPISVASEPSIGSDTQAITFRVALAGNDANRGVRISLTPALTYAIKRDAAAFAFDGQEQTPLNEKGSGYDRRLHLRDDEDAGAPAVTLACPVRSRPDPGRSASSRGQG
jgi:hypothetical protein